MHDSQPQEPIDYRALAETVPAIVFVAETGPQARWIYVSEWIEPVLGFTVQEWTGQRAMWSRQLHPDDRLTELAAENAAVARALAQIAAGVDPRHDGFKREYRMRHRDGRAVWVREDSVLAQAPDGELRWHGVMFDITDQKQVEQELERRSSAQAAVAQLGEQALRGGAIADLLEASTRALTTVLGADMAVVWRISHDLRTRELCASSVTSNAAVLPARQSLLTPGSPAAQAAQTGAPVLVESLDDDPQLIRALPAEQLGIKSSVTVPIAGQPQVWGLLGAYSQTPRAFSEHDVNFVVALANTVAEAIERRQAQDAMEHRALHDLLTGLPNRGLFADRLDQALERMRRHSGLLAALLFIDLDHFKQVNDTLGHQAGDELLTAVATRLREAVRPSDTVARFGGDEFGLLLEEIDSERTAIATAERIAASFSRPFVLAAGPQFVSASIGIALADGHDQATALLRDADAAMYRAKQRGRARYDVFDDELRMRAQARDRTEAELHRALEGDELRLVFQPVVDIKTERVNGVEALLRWDHPSRGELLPADFIAVAEESGLIDRVGQWVIDQALAHAAHWEQLQPDLAPIRVGVNVSVTQLQNPRFLELLTETIQSAGIEPHTLALELDERVLRDEAEQMRSMLRLLKRIGVRIAVHDFGTGDSSLRQLAALPVDTIKVQRRFVSALGTTDADASIAQALIATGRALELHVIGLGVETAEQVRQLRDLGCNSAQGFLFSEPVSAQEFSVLLEAGGQLQRTLG
jgi:diguanylate cyclase (GGDEF)-like protein/PAS domain S-box-containing protein